MAAQGYEDDFDAYDDDDSDESDDWALLSSSRSPSPPPPVQAPPPPQPPAPTRPLPVSVRSTTTTIIPSSPQCSMDDDSSTDGEEVLPSISQRGAAASRGHGKSEHDSQVSVQQRKAKVRELVSRYHKECANQYHTLISLQRQWRQELDDPVPGLTNYDYLQPEEVLKQREIMHPISDRRVQSSAPKSRTNSSASAKYHNTIISGGNAQGSGKKIKHGFY